MPSQSTSAVRSPWSWLVAAGAALWLACAAHAQTPGEDKQKESYELLRKVDAGARPDLIVEFVPNAQAEAVENGMLRERDGTRRQAGLNQRASRLGNQRARVLGALASSDVTVLRQYSHLPMTTLRVANGAALRRLLAHAGVLRVHESQSMKLFLAESLPLIGQPQVAQQGYRGSGTAVAVLDLPVDYRNSAFGSCPAPGAPGCKILFQRDFGSDGGRVPVGDHGTNVAGIVLGVAPESKVVALNVFTASATGGDPSASTADILNAINWVIANSAAYNIVAINMSLGGGRYTTPDSTGAFETAIRQARQAGVLSIVAAGNDAYKNALASPAASPSAVSVGAVYDANLGQANWRVCTDLRTAADQVTCFSNSASFLTLLAPGSAITAAGITQSGTSQATPHVAGAVALLRAAFPQETLDQTVARLQTGPRLIDAGNDLAKPRLSLPLALGTTQACTYRLSENTRSIEQAGATASVSVTTASGCTWSGAPLPSAADWITLGTPSSGSGNGTFNYIVKPNLNAASRTGALTIAGLSYVVTQNGSTAAAANYLQNSSFENGPIAWLWSARNGLDIITSFANPSTNNGWYAWLCGYSDCLDQLYQDVYVPADASSAYLQFNYNITTTESTTVRAYDTLTVSAISPTGTAPSLTLATLSNLDATTGWRASPRYDVSAYRGKTVRIQFTATTDATFASNFFVDDVYLMVTGAAPDRQPPTVPTGLAATVLSASRISLSWQPSTDNVGVVAYKIYRDGIQAATVAQTSGPTFADTGLNASQRYQYAVSACDAAGNCSATSVAVAATTQALLADAVAPSIPSGLTVTALSASAVWLNWTASVDNVGVTNYRIYRNGALITTQGAATTFTDAGLVPSTRYSYTVSACDLAGNCSAQSAVGFGTTLAILTNVSTVGFTGAANYTISGNTVSIHIDKITNTSGSYRSGSLRLELWALQGPYTGVTASGYKLAGIRTSAISGLSDQIAPNGLFQNINLNLPFTPAPPGYTSYVLFLEEYDAGRCTSGDGFCVIAYLQFHETQSPSVPTGLVASTASSSQINLRWNPSTDDTGVATYKVFRNGALLATLGNVVSFSDIGLPPLSTFSYAVMACDAFDNCSGTGAVVTASTAAPPDTTPPAIPLGLRAVAVGPTHVLLSWTASTDNVGVTSYKVYSGGQLVATLGNVTSSFRTNLPSSSYSYAVAACDAAGNCSASSVAAAVTTPAATVPVTSTATFAIPWLTNNISYVTRMAIANNSDVDASYRVQVLTEAGNSVVLNPGLSTGALPAGKETIINISDLIQSFSGNAQGSAVITVTGPVDAISGIYNIVNPVTGSISNTTMIRSGAGAAARLRLPTFSTSAGATNKLFFMNDGTAPVVVTPSFLTAPGTTATARQPSWTVAAQSQLMINTGDLANLVGGQQAAAAFVISGNADAVKAIYQTASTSTGSISNLTLTRPSTLAGATTTLLMPWFSINPDYLSRFYLTNSSSSPAPYTLQVMTEPGNTASVATSSGVIPANGQVVIESLSLVRSFSGPPRGGAVFTVQAAPSVIDGVYQITNPTTGSVSNTTLIRPSASPATTTRLSVPWFSINPYYVSRFVLMNRGSTPAAFGISVQAENNNTPTQIASSLVIPPNSLYVVVATDLVSAFSSAPRGAIVFDFAASDNQIDGLYNIVNPATGSISNTIMMRSGPEQ